MVPNDQSCRKQRAGSFWLGSNAPLAASGSKPARTHSYAGRTQDLAELSRSPSVDIGQVPSLADLAGAEYSWDSHPSKTSVMVKIVNNVACSHKFSQLLTVGSVWFQFLFVVSPIVCSFAQNEVCQNKVTCHLQVPPVIFRQIIPTRTRIQPTNIHHCWILSFNQQSK